MLNFGQFWFPVAFKKEGFLSQIPCHIISLPLFCECQHSFPSVSCLNTTAIVFIHTGERNWIASRVREAQRDNSARMEIEVFSVHSAVSLSLISPSRHQPASDLWTSPARRVELHADTPAVQSLSCLALSCHAALHTSPPASLHRSLLSCYQHSILRLVEL